LDAKEEEVAEGSLSSRRERPALGSLFSPTPQQCNNNINPAFAVQSPRSKPLPSTPTQRNTSERKQERRELPFPQIQPLPLELNEEPVFNQEIEMAEEKPEKPEQQQQPQQERREERRDDAYSTPRKNSITGSISKRTNSAGMMN
jgi:hypothetical protein